MQSKSFHLKRQVVGSLPIVDQFLQRLRLRALLLQFLKNERYAAAIDVLVKNLLTDPAALYRIPEWTKQHHRAVTGGFDFSDDVIGRALDRLFTSDRATLLTTVSMNAVKGFEVDTSEIHNDSTSIKFFGQYRSRTKKGVKPKRGHSKDHRPDLKQVLYSLSVARDGAVPVHYKAYDGNVTDDTTHWDTWQSLRSILRRHDFLYVADCKLCTKENMERIDRENGRFVTIVPETRAETDDFAELCHVSAVRWQYLTKRQLPSENGRF